MQMQNFALNIFRKNCVKLTHLSKDTLCFVFTKVNQSFSHSTCNISTCYKKFVKSTYSSNNILRIVFTKYFSTSIFSHCNTYRLEFSYVETTTTGPQSVSWRHFSTMFISSTRALVEVGTLWPWGQHISWKSWQVLVGAFTPAISSVSETIWKRSIMIIRERPSRFAITLIAQSYFDISLK